MRGANSRDADLRERARAVIPGGMYGHQSTALLPDDYPQFFTGGQGAWLEDADGRRYLDFMCAYGPNLFGYRHGGIDAAFVRQLGVGDTLTGPTGLMVELAEAFVGMVGHAAWAVFCKNGTDATSLALMVARQHTGRRTVVRAKGAYHGAAAWCTPRPAGVIESDRAHQVFCDYNDVESLRAAAAQAGDDLACIFAAPFRHDAFVDQAEPSGDYARAAREICDRTGALLVVDEVRAGFRLSRDCSWSRLGVQPDLSTWGKGIANGHALSALLGGEAARKAASQVYATGSFWCQAAPMAAALETLRLIRETDYLETMAALGERLRAGLARQAAAAGVGLRQTGPAVMPLFLFDDDPDLRKGFRFGSEMLARGVYVHPWHNMFLCAAMTEADIDLALAAAGEALAVVARDGPGLAPVEKMAFLAAGAR